MVILFPCGVFSAQITLKEGKTLVGKITEEDANEIMLNLGSNMYLKVQKSTIKEIIRDPKSTRKIVTLDTVNKSTATISVSTTVVKASSPKPVEHSSLVQFSDQVTSDVKKFGNIQFQKTLQIKTISQRGVSFEVVKNSKTFLQDIDSKLIVTFSGEPIQKDNHFEWKALTVLSSETYTASKWEAPKKIDPKSIEEWNAYIVRLEAQKKGLQSIYQNTLDSLKESMPALQGKTSDDLQQVSAATLKDTLARMEHQKKGFFRRLKEPSHQIEK